MIADSSTDQDGGKRRLGMTLGPGGGLRHRHK